MTVFRSLSYKRPNARIKNDFQIPSNYMTSRMISVLISYLASHISCIVARGPDKCWLSHGMCLYQVMVTLHFLNDVATGAEST